jgi:hypothetical protein
MQYDYAVPTLGHFLKRIAIDYMRYGYVRWVIRNIPPERDPKAVDIKLVETYGVTQCRTRRLRSKRQGQAIIQYVRWGNTFVLLATQGEHELFSKLCSYDARSTPLHIERYSIGMMGSKVVVKVRHQIWEAVWQRFEKLALYDHKVVEGRLNALSFYRFPGVVHQLYQLTRAINQRRRVAGLSRVKLKFREFLRSKKFRDTD